MQVQRLVSFIAGVMTGAIVGATIALLITPTSGIELRGQISTRAQSIRDEVTAAAAARRADLEQQLAALRAPRTVAPPQETKE